MLCRNQQPLQWTCSQQVRRLRQRPQGASSLQPQEQLGRLKYHRSPL